MDDIHSSFAGRAACSNDEQDLRLRQEPEEPLNLASF
jgi:hypothetical protein